jgi:hypothetical protein
LQRVQALLLMPLSLQACSAHAQHLQSGSSRQEGFRGSCALQWQCTVIAPRGIYENVQNIRDARDCCCAGHSPAAARAAVCGVFACVCVCVCVRIVVVVASTSTPLQFLCLAYRRDTVVSVEHKHTIIVQCTRILARHSSQKYLAANHYSAHLLSRLSARHGRSAN